MKKKESTRGRDVLLTLLGSLQISPSNFKKLIPDLGERSFLGNIVECIKDADYEGGRNRKDNFVLASNQKSLLEYKILNATLLIEMSSIIGDKNLRQKHNFLNQIVNKIKVAVKSEVAATFEVLMKSIEDNTLDDIVLCESFISYLTDILSHFDPKVLNLFSQLEGFFITMLYILRKNEEGLKSNNSYKKLIQKLREGLSKIYLSLNETAIQNIIGTLCGNASIMFDLMTDSVRIVESHSCYEFLEKFSQDHSITLSKGNALKYEKYIPSLIPLLGGDSLKFRWFCPSILSDILAVISDIFANVDLKTRIECGTIIFLLRSFGDTDISDVSDGDKNLILLEDVFEEFCKLITVCCRRLIGFSYKLYPEFLSKVFKLKMYERPRFLILLSKLLTEISHLLPVNLHNELLTGDIGIAFLLSKLLIFNDQDRQALETNHEKIKKIEKIKIFSNNTLNWTEKVLQNEDTPTILLLRETLLKYFAKLLSWKAFRDSLNQNQTAEFGGYIIFKVINKLKVFSDYTDVEKDSICKIVASLPYIKIRQEEKHVYDKEAMEETLGFFDSAILLGLDTVEHRDRVLETTELLMQTSSVLGKRAAIDEYLEAYLKDYTEQAKKLLKLQIQSDELKKANEGLQEVAEDEQEAPKETKKTAIKFSFAPAVGGESQILASPSVSSGKESAPLSPQPSIAFSDEDIPQLNL